MGKQGEGQEVSITRLPPGPEPDDLRFQRWQWETERFGSTAARQFLSQDALKKLFRDVTLGRLVASIMEKARVELVKPGPDDPEEP